MAITATGTNPIIVTGTCSAKDDILITTRRVVVEAVYWLAPSGDRDFVELQDGLGAEKIGISCKNDDEDVYFWTPVVFNDGIYCDRMDSGILYVFLRNE